MSGEITGTKVIISNGTGDIVGQGSFTLTYGGTPIDISNKSNGDWVTLLENEGAGKQYIYAGTLVYNDDAQYEKVKADSIAHVMDDYTITYMAGNTTEESYAGKFMPTGMSDALPHGDKVETSISFNSSDEVIRTAPIA